MALTKSPNLRVPSFLMYRRTSVDTTSVFSWNPAVGKVTNYSTGHQDPIIIQVSLTIQVGRG